MLVLGCNIAVASFAQNSAWFEVRGGDWHPSPEVTLRLQTELEPAIAKLAGNKFERFRPWHEYKFQFQGRRKDSQQYVFISALCNAYEMRDLTEKFVVVFDGGSCFYEVKYDPKSQRFYDLLVHGEA